MGKYKFNSRNLLAINVRYLRFEKGWSQEELSDRSKLSATSISKIEKAKCNTGIDYVDDLAYAFDLASPDYLLQDHGFRKISTKRIDSKTK
jgi:transcriptional regulator with XRE-family HTH domain